MRRRSLKGSKLWAFLVGLGSMTQITLVGSIGISEVVVCLMAPVIFIQDYHQLKRDGFTLLLGLVALTCISCCISCVINHTIFAAAIRGFAAPYVLWAGLIVMHRILRRDLTALSWFVVGFALSNVVNIFIFHQGADATLNGQNPTAVTDAIVSGPLFWLSRLRYSFLDIPIAGFYQHIPLPYCVLAPLAMVVVAFSTSDSGRSMAMTFIVSAGLFVLGGKRVSKMKALSRNFLWLALAAIVTIFAFKQVYVMAAQKGFLTEKALRKYEEQTKAGSGLISLIVAGRTETFIGASAALRRPFFGYGPWPLDTEGISEEFLYNYGSPEDIAIHERTLRDYARFGINLRQRFIPCHSHIIYFWVWFGLVGAFVWMYVLFAIVRHFIKNIDAVPRWYGYFALFLPTTVWNILFSPFGSRMHTITVVTAVLIANAVRKGNIQLPFEMMVERERGFI